MAYENDHDEKEPASTSSPKKTVTDASVLAGNKRKASPGNSSSTKDSIRKKRNVFPEYDDKAGALAAVRYDGRWLKNRSDRLRDDEEVVRAALAENPDAFQYASLRLRSRPDVIMAALSSSTYYRPVCIRHAPHRVFERNNREFVLSLVRAKPRCFEHLPTENLVDVDWRDDRELALAAVEGDANQADFVSRRLRSDRDIVLASVGSRWFAKMVKGTFQHNNIPSEVRERLLNDEEVMLKAIRKDPTFLPHASEELRDNRQIAAAAIESGVGSSDSLWALSDNLKADRELNLLAARGCGCILNLQLFGGDREIVLAAVTRNGRLWSQLTGDLRGDAEIALAATNSHPRIYTRLPGNLRNDRAIAMAAVSDADQLQSLPAEFRGDRKIVMRALHGYSQDKESYEIEEGEPPVWFSYVSEELRSDPDIIQEALARNGLFLRDAVLGDGRRDVELVRGALENDLRALSFVPSGLDCSPEIAAAAIRATNTTNNPVSHDLDYVRNRLGAPLLRKLVAIYDEYKLEAANSDQIVLSEHKDVDGWREAWTHRLWHKIWLLNEATNAVDVPRDARDAIVRFSDILPDFRLARKISDVGPVVEALAELEVGVDEFLDGVLAGGDTGGSSSSEENASD